MDPTLTDPMPTSSASRSYQPVATRADVRLVCGSGRLAAAGRSAHPGVPAGGVRRRRRARRVPRPRPAPARRRAGALLRRHPATSRASPRTRSRPSLAGANAALRTMGVDLAMAAGCAGADVVHSHTWYANLAGHVAKLLHGVPHVVTTHSLEPLRPWKAEQLGGGYALSSCCERTAIEARRRGHRGLRRACAGTCWPPTRRSTRTGSRWSTTASTPSSTRRTAAPTCSTGSASTRPRPASSSSAGSPGRRACRTCCGPAATLPPEAQIVLLAGAPDTPGDRRRGGAAWPTSCATAATRA